MILKNLTLLEYAEYFSYTSLTAETCRISKEKEMGTSLLGDT